MQHVSKAWKDISVAISKDILAYNLKPQVALRIWRMGLAAWKITGGRKQSTMIDLGKENRKDNAK